MKSIVVGTDGSETASRAVRAAGQLSLKTGGRVHLVSAYQPRSVGRVSFVASPGPKDSTWEANLEKEVEALLQDAASTLTAMGASVECHPRAGDAAAAILEVAEEQSADLIIVGNRGMRGAQRFLLGSVPGKISHHATCSVMIIRTVQRCLSAAGIELEQAMSQESVEIARAFFEAWNAGDMDAVRELYHPDAILRMAPDWPEPGP